MDDLAAILVDVRPISPADDEISLKGRFSVILSGENEEAELFFRKISQNLMPDHRALISIKEISILLKPETPALEACWRFSNFLMILVRTRAINVIQDAANCFAKMLPSTDREFFFDFTKKLLKQQNNFGHNLVLILMLPAVLRQGRILSGPEDTEIAESVEKLTSQFLELTKSPNPLLRKYTARLSFDFVVESGQDVTEGTWHFIEIFAQDICECVRIEVPMLIYAIIKFSATAKIKIPVLRRLFHHVKGVNEKLLNSFSYIGETSRQVWISIFLILDEFKKLRDFLSFEKFLSSEIKILESIIDDHPEPYSKSLFNEFQPAIDCLLQKNIHSVSAPVILNRILEKVEDAANNEDSSTNREQSAVLIGALISKHGHLPEFPSISEVYQNLMNHSHESIKLCLADGLLKIFDSKDCTSQAVEDISMIALDLNKSLSWRIRIKSLGLMKKVFGKCKSKKLLVEAIFQTFQDEVWMVRQETILTIGAISLELDPPILEMLVNSVMELFTTGNYEIRLSVFKCLAVLLIQMLKGNKQNRMTLKLITFLIDASSDPTPNVRFHVAMFCNHLVSMEISKEKLSEWHISECLLKLKNDPDSGVAGAAAGLMAPARLSFT
eukprot:GHVP01029921.1.p1 GENE.GHVP01029921.1~~GHVP01029921.1.p1  ORF type:complete len:613 (+),score=112.59 GHVP01029921.1:1385-3223(+)